MGASVAVRLERPVLAVSSPSSELDEFDDSDFEFDLSEVYSEEPPPSPNLHNFSHNWVAASINTLCTMHASPAEHNYARAATMDALQNGIAVDSDTIFKRQHNHVIDRNQQMLRIGNLGDDVLMNTRPGQRLKKRPNLRSLMLERLQLVGANLSNGAADRKDADEMISRSSSSGSSSDASSSSSPSVSSASTCLASPQHHKRKSRRRTLTLDFLNTKKASSRAKAVDYPYDHAILCAPPVLDEPSQTNDHDAAVISNGKVESSRRSVGTLSSYMYSRDASSPEKADRGITMGQRRKSKSTSAPVSPSASPLRAVPSIPSAQSGHLMDRKAGGVKGAMSPHAQHYQQQRARTEELRRRTFLPYRHSLLMATSFFPSPRRLLIP